MKIRFWGVRGSVPSPGPSTVRYGGNTACVSVEFVANRLLVLDAGTGIRELGKWLEGREMELFLLLSHNHWDHIQGFPFFNAIYQSNRKIYMFPTPGAKQMLCSLIDQMDGAHFPISPDKLPSQYVCVIDNALDFLRSHGFDISRIATNHPGGGYGYRIQNEGKTVVYITDNELESTFHRNTEYSEFIRFCTNADILIHDAQYLNQDMPHKQGWGHSLVSQACDLAAAAAVKHLILFHHDPDRIDKELDSIQEEARAWFSDKGMTTLCTAAFEGLTLEV